MNTEQTSKNIFMYINKKLQHFCNSQGLPFIDNKSKDRSCLNKGKLHQKIVGSL